MAKITWLGEDSPEVAGPSFTTAFGGIRFPKGEPVEIVDKDMIRRARSNPFFEVSGVPGRPPAVKAVQNAALGMANQSAGQASQLTEKPDVEDPN